MSADYQERRPASEVNYTKAFQGKQWEPRRLGQLKLDRAKHLRCCGHSGSGRGKSQMTSQLFSLTSCSAVLHGVLNVFPTYYVS